MTHTMSMRRAAAHLALAAAALGLAGMQAASTDDGSYHARAARTHPWVI